MNLQLPADIEASMRAFIASGNYTNEEEVLRKALAALNRYEQDVAAIQEGIDDMEAGRYRPWEEVKAELRTKFGSGNP